MAKFKINEGYKSEKTVEANLFEETDSLVVFIKGYDVNAEQVYALSKSNVHSIERIED